MIICYKIIFVPNISPMKKLLLSLFTLFFLSGLMAQNYVSKVWVSDLGNGNYKNPVLYADYSDPDVVRVDSDYYMTASSFDAVPGLPVLHSRDLVNWKIIGHALSVQPPVDHFSLPQHGNGVWAPAIRFHKGMFYIYYPDPDFGIYVITAKDAHGPWSLPVLVDSGKGLIDPCPLWDDDGQLYLAHALAGSRAGLKSVIVIKKMNADGTKVTDAGRIVYDGHVTDPTIEGPKIYKKEGYYYILAPAGGVSTGWQLALRSKNIYGPYERKVVMDQGHNIINGPHQGAWINTVSGEDWFIHFQDLDAYGRVTLLEPMHWKNGWPVIGEDKKNTGKGEPVTRYKKPDVGKSYPVQTPVESDEFDKGVLGLQWQWQANPKLTWMMTDSLRGKLRLYAYAPPYEGVHNYWDIPNLLLQKIPAPEFTATTKLSFYPDARQQDEKTGLIVMGQSYAALQLVHNKDGIALVYTKDMKAEKGEEPSDRVLTQLKQDSIYLRVVVTKGVVCCFSYSLDGKVFSPVDDIFTAMPGKWIGAKIGIFCTKDKGSNDAGYADFDWFRITPAL